MISQYDCREIHFLYFLKQKMTKGIACYDQHEFFIVKLHGLVLRVFENLRIEPLTLKNSRADARESVFINDQYFFHEKRRITDILIGTGSGNYRSLNCCIRQTIPLLIHLIAMTIPNTTILLH